MKLSNEIRSLFLDYFKERQHKIVNSAPIVVKDDPTLLFTNAGMNQFKDNFLGLKEPIAARVADTQKCMRVSGKHNDLDDVGHDTYHHTMFEMLGNWSFGDYYKKEAIEWAWDLLTNVYGLEKERLYVTIFGGEEADGLGADEEARKNWQQFVPDARILECSKKDNFWEMGETGPCGPSSEIHIDLRPESDRQAVPGATLVNQDDPLVIEIWNLVFMEFNRLEDRSLIPLPAKNVDTGMGFERLCMALQAKTSNYDTDLFAAYIEYLENKTGKQYGQDEETTIAMRVVMDHIRAVSFAIGDGQRPSNTKAGYVIRRILRRASRYAFSFLGLNEPFMHEMVSMVARQYLDIFPELTQQQDFIQQLVREEEKSFLKKLERGIQMFDAYIREQAGGDNEVDGEFAFRLYDTYGFPVDLTRVMAEEKGWKLDEAGFETHMEAQKNRSRSATEVKAGDWVELDPETGISTFLGYDQLTSEASIVRYRTLKMKKDKAWQIVLDKTPFYAEGGGQVGDTGWLEKGEERIRVLDTKKENDLIVHFTNKLPENPEGEWFASVDAERRRKITANHSATHLVHAALRNVLGKHVEQRGSLVSDSGLRFDFSHHAKMTADEVAQVEEMVNHQIMRGIALEEKRAIPKEEAEKMGAMALFGEKYGETVRVIIFDPAYSVELCGGIHVSNTNEIRLFKIVSESSIATGVRRIEALTADGALTYLNDRFGEVEAIKGLMKNPKDLIESVSKLIDKNKALEREIEQLSREKLNTLRTSLKEKVKAAGAYQILAEVVEVRDKGDLKALAFELRKGLKETLIVLGADFNGKPLLNVARSEDLDQVPMIDAKAIIKELAPEIGGGGGGQAHFASAGGKNAAGLPKAMEKAVSWLQAGVPGE